MRLACAIVLVVGLVMPAKAEDGRGWSFSGSFSGSSNTDGIVMKTDPKLGYTFSSHFQTYAGVPFYFVNMSTMTPTTGTASAGGFMNGIGNAFLGGRFDVSSDALNYSSTLELTAPTGEQEPRVQHRTGHRRLDEPLQPQNGFVHAVRQCRTREYGFRYKILCPPFHVSWYGR